MGTAAASPARLPRRQAPGRLCHRNPLWRARPGDHCGPRWRQRLPAHTWCRLRWWSWRLPLTVNGSDSTRGPCRPWSTRAPPPRAVHGHRGPLAGIYAQVLGWSGSGPMTRSSIWAGIRCRRRGRWREGSWSRGVEVRFVVFEVRRSRGWPHGLRGQRPASGGGAVDGTSPRPAVVPLSFAQSRLWFWTSCRALAGVQYGGRAATAGSWMSRRWGWRWVDVVGRHESLRTIFVLGVFRTDGCPGGAG